VDLFEDLVEKIIQWEQTFKTSRNTNPISLKRGIHFIESSIAAKTRMANLSRRLKLLETKEPILVNQVSPNPIQNPDCTYCQTMNYMFEECLIFHTQQMFPEHMNVALSRSHNNLYAQTYNLGWRNHLNFS